MIFTCASDLSSSSARCVELATPDEPNVIVSGLALASAISSLTLFTPRSGFTTSTVGVEVRSAIGAKSLMMSKFRLGLIAALTRLATEATNSMEPSLGARATVAAAMLDAAPVRFSITNCWPRICPILPPITRAEMSAVEPAENPLTMCTGAVG